MPAPSEEGTCNSALAMRLLLVENEAELKGLARAGWIKPIALDRWRTADIVQGRIKQLAALGTTYNAEQMAGALALTSQRPVRDAPNDDGLLFPLRSPPISMARTSPP